MKFSFKFGAGGTSNGRPALSEPALHSQPGVGIEGRICVAESIKAAQPAWGKMSCLSRLVGRSLGRGSPATPSARLRPSPGKQSARSIHVQCGKLKQLLGTRVEFGPDASLPLRLNRINSNITCAAFQFR